MSYPGEERMENSNNQHNVSLSEPTERFKMESEQLLRYLAHQKLAGNGDVSNSNQLNDMDFGDIKPSKKRLLSIAIQLIKKPCLSENDICALELALSSIICNLDPQIKEILSAEGFDSIESLFSPIALKSISDSNSTLVDDILNMTVLDDALSYIYSKKAELTSQGLRSSEEFLVISILQRVLESFDLCGKKVREEPEHALYLRFASILDLLFAGTNVEIADGEKGAQSNQMDGALFHLSDNLATYPRKIDLLLNLNDQDVELSSNEWKKSAVSDAVALKQQVINLKTNCCILSNLRCSFGPQFTTVLGMDWIGNVGYLYKIEKKDDVFIADTIGTLVLPESMDTFVLFKDTLISLLKFKYFISDMCTQLKKESLKLDVQRITKIGSTTYTGNSSTSS